MEPQLAALAYQTHGEGWRLGTGADVNLHIQHGSAVAVGCVSARAKGMEACHGRDKRDGPEASRMQMEARVESERRLTRSGRDDAV